MRHHPPLIWRILTEAGKTLVVLASFLLIGTIAAGLIAFQPGAWLVLGIAVTITVIIPIWSWFHEPSRQEHP